jgi:hypothetical protein
MDDCMGICETSRGVLAQDNSRGHLRHLSAVVMLPRKAAWSDLWSLYKTLWQCGAQATQPSWLIRSLDITAMKSIHACTGHNNFRTLPALCSGCKEQVSTTSQIELCTLFQDTILAPAGDLCRSESLPASLSLSQRHQISSWF